MTGPDYLPYDDRFTPEEPAAAAARRFYETMSRRRTVRMFSDRPVDREVIEWLVRTAGSSPSGANKQPWRFVCVQDSKLKREIRIAAEKEERELYSHRANEEWLADPKPNRTDENKAFIETAPT